MKPHFDAIPQLKKLHNYTVSLRIRLISLSLILFVIALGFNVIFTSASLDKLYIDSMISKYRVIAMDLQRKVETGLRYGKPLKNYFGLTELAHQASLDLQNNINREDLFDKNFSFLFSKTDIGLAIISSDGEVLFNDGASEFLPSLLLGKRLKDGKDSGKTTYFKVSKNYATAIEIKEPKGAVAGTIFLSFNENKIKIFIKSLLERNVKVIGLVMLFGGMALFLFICILTSQKNMVGGWPKRKISLTIFLIIGTAQIATCGLLTRDYNDYFFQVNKDNATTINILLANDINYLLSLGVKLERLAGFEIYLKKIMSSVPEINDITCFDRSHQPLYRSTKKQVTDFKRSISAYDQWNEAIKPLTNPEFNAKRELCGDGANCGYFSTNVSKDILSGKVIDIAMDSMTIIIVSILFFVELLILTSNYFEMQIKGGEENKPIHYGVMRPAIFLFLFGLDLPMSFLPLHMETLYEPLLGLSKDSVLGLPISAEFLFVGISIIISGIWHDRRGWSPPFMAGIFLAIAGSIYSWLATDSIHFVISRAVVGLGYGLSLMASQGFVIAHSDQKSKAQALANLFAGIYAGSICGNATGAIMAEWLGYAPVFLFGALIIILVLVYTIFFMRQAMKKPIQTLIVKSQEVSVSTGHLALNFITNRSILGLIFFSSLPAAIAVIGFLNYFSPIYLKHLGTSQSTIGQILMLYGICLIYFGPFISRYVDASRNKKLYIFIGCILGGLALLTFQVFEGLTAAILAVLLLGLSSSLVLASQTAFALDLNVTHELGEGKAIAIFRSTSRIGQMLGPIVFSAVIVATNPQTGITWLGVAYLITAILFIVIAQTDNKTVVVENV